MPKAIPKIYASVILSPLDNIMEKVSVEFDSHGSSVIELKTELPKKIFCILNPGLIAKFFTTKGLSITKPEGMIPREEYLMGSALISDTGTDWSRKRKALSMPFLPKNMTSFFSELEPATLSFFARLDHYAESGQVVNICYETRKFIIDLSLRMLFSTSLDKTSLNKITEIVSDIEENLPEQTPLFLPTPSNLRFKRNCNNLKKFLLDLITERRSTPGNNDDFLTYLLNIEDVELGRDWNNDELVDQMLGIFLGASALSTPLFWSIYSLTANPLAKGEIYKEYSQVSKGEFISNLEGIKSLKYLDMFFKECMRVYPPFWGNIRFADQAYDFDDYHFPKNSTFLLLRYFANRNPDYWENPQAFDPLRFAPDNPKLVKGQHYIPFGAGPRTCLGIHMGPHICKTALGGLIKRYDLSYPVTTPNGEPQVSFMYGLYPKKNILLNFTKRPAN